MCGHSPFLMVPLFPENWVCLLVGIEPKDPAMPKSQRRRDLLLAVSKENTRDLSQRSLSLNSTTGGHFKLREHASS